MAILKFQLLRVWVALFYFSLIISQMKWALFVTILILSVLQLSLWFGDSSLPDAWRLKKSIVEQREQNQHLTIRNQTLKAEVLDLKEGDDAIEERARSELGMIKKGEKFYQIIEE